MKIRWKIFFLIWSVVLLIAIALIVTSGIYLERFYLKNKRERLRDVANILVDPNIAVDFRRLEIQNNVDIQIKGTGALRSEVYGKEVADEIEEVRKELELRNETIKELKLNDYRGKVLILFRKYRNDRYIEITTPISAIKEEIDISVKYTINLVFFSLGIGTVVAFFFSKEMIAPILELKDITQRISKFDFSTKFKRTTNDEVGELGSAINTMSDIIEKNIEEIKEVNNKLLKDIEYEKKIDKSRQEFIAYVSHELKTPIAIIQGYAQGLMENITTEEDKNFYCEIIMEESSKMNRLVRELIGITRLESGQYKVEKEKLDLSELIADCIEKYDDKIEFKNSKELICYYDESVVEKILDNLIGNAIKYNTSNEKVEINVLEDEKKYRIVVTNKNNSLKEEDIKIIWAPFVRTSSSIGKDGHGLGLAIVKAFLKTHNSEGGVYLSEKDKVNFWFELDKFKGEDTFERDEK